MEKVGRAVRKAKVVGKVEGGNKDGKEYKRC